MSAQGACSRGHLPSHAGLQGGARALGASHIPGQCLEPQRAAKSSFSQSSRSFLEAMRAFKELASGGTRKAAERCGPDTAGPAAQRGPPGTPGRRFPYSSGQFHSVNSYHFSEKCNVIKTFAQHLVHSSDFPP